MGDENELRINSLKRNQGADSYKEPTEEDVSSDESKKPAEQLIFTDNGKTQAGKQRQGTYGYTIETFKISSGEPKKPAEQPLFSDGMQVEQGDYQPVFLWNEGKDRQLPLILPFDISEEAEAKFEKIGAEEYLGTSALDYLPQSVIRANMPSGYVPTMFRQGENFSQEEFFKIVGNEIPQQGYGKLKRFKRPPIFVFKRETDKPYQLNLAFMDSLNDGIGNLRFTNDPNVFYADRSGNTILLHQYDTTNYGTIKLCEGLEVFVPKGKMEYPDTLIPNLQKTNSVRKPFTLADLRAWNMGMITLTSDRQRAADDSTGNTIYVPGGYEMTLSPKALLKLMHLQVYAKDKDTLFTSHSPLYTPAHTVTQIMNHGFVGVTASAWHSTKAKKEQMDRVTDAYIKETNKFGAVDAFQQVVSEAFGGISLDELDKTWQSEMAELIDLQKAAKNIKDFNTLNTFMSKYHSATLVDFEAENIYKLQEAQAMFHLASCAKLYKKVADELKKDQELADWRKEICDFSCLESLDKYAHDPSYQAFLKSRFSPLEKALMKRFNNNTELCKEWLKAKGGSNKSYRALFNEFIKESDELNAAAFKNEDFESIATRYRCTLQNTLGKCYTEEALSKFIDNQAICGTVMNMALLIGVSLMTGGSALAAAGAFAAVSTLDEATDAEGLTVDDIHNITRDTALTYASFKLFSLVANKVTPATYKTLCTQFNVSPEKAVLIAKLAGSSAAGFTSGSTMRLGIGLVAGEEVTTALKESLKSGLYGGAIAAGFCLVGDAYGKIKGKISEAKYAKMQPHEQARYDYENLLKTLKHTQKDNPEYKVLMRDIKGDEFSPDSVNKVLEFMRKLYDGVYFSPKDISTIEMKTTDLKPTKATEIMPQGTPDTTAQAGKVSTERALMYKYSSPDCNGGTLLTLEEQATLGAFCRFRNSAIRFLEAQSQQFINVEDPALPYSSQPAAAQPLALSARTNPVVEGFNKVCPSLKPTALIPPTEQLSTTVKAKAEIKAKIAEFRPDIDMAALEKCTLEQLQNVEKLALCNKDGQYTFKANEVRAFGLSQNAEMVDAMVSGSTSPNGPKVTKTPTAPAAEAQVAPKRTGKISFGSLSSSVSSQKGKTPAQSSQKTEVPKTAKENSSAKQAAPAQQAQPSSDLPKTKVKDAPKEIKIEVMPDSPAKGKELTTTQSGKQGTSAVSTGTKGVAKGKTPAHKTKAAPQSEPQASQAPDIMPDTTANPAANSAAVIAGNTVVDKKSSDNDYKVAAFQPLEDDILRPLDDEDTATVNNTEAAAETSPSENPAAQEVPQEIIDKNKQIAQIELDRIKEAIGDIDLDGLIDVKYNPDGSIAAIYQGKENILKIKDDGSKILEVIQHTEYGNEIKDCIMVTGRADAYINSISTRYVNGILHEKLVISQKGYTLTSYKNGDENNRTETRTELGEFGRTTKTIYENGKKVVSKSEYDGYSDKTRIVEIETYDSDENLIQKEITTTSYDDGSKEIITRDKDDYIIKKVYKDKYNNITREIEYSREEIELISSMLKKELETSKIKLSKRIFRNFMYEIAESGGVKSDYMKTILRLIKNADSTDKISSNASVIILKSNDDKSTCIYNFDDKGDLIKIEKSIKTDAEKLSDLIRISIDGKTAKVTFGSFLFTSEDKGLPQKLKTIEIDLNAVDEAFFNTLLIHPEELFSLDDKTQGLKVIYNNSSKSKIGNAEFKVEEGSAVIKTTEEGTAISQMDDAKAPNPTSERITYKRENGSTTVVDFDLDDLLVTFENTPTGNGKRLIKAVGENKIDISSEITPTTVTISNNLTGKTIEFPVSEILSRCSLSFQADNASALLENKILDLLRKLPPTVVLSLRKLLDYPEAKIVISDNANADSYVYGKNIKILNLFKDADVETACHEILHAVNAMSNIENDDDIILAHHHELEASKNLADFTQYAAKFDTEKWNKASAEQTELESQGIRELISIIGTLNLFGYEWADRAEQARLQFPKTSKLIEKRLMQWDLDNLAFYGLAEKTDTPAPAATTPPAVSQSGNTQQAHISRMQEEISLDKPFSEEEIQKRYEKINSIITSISPDFRDEYLLKDLAKMKDGVERAEFIGQIFDKLERFSRYSFSYAVERITDMSPERYERFTKLYEYADKMYLYSKETKDININMLIDIIQSPITCEKVGWLTGENQGEMPKDVKLLKQILEEYKGEEWNNDIFFADLTTLEKIIELSQFKFTKNGIEKHGLDLKYAFYMAEAENGLDVAKKYFDICQSGNISPAKAYSIHKLLNTPNILDKLDKVAEIVRAAGELSIDSYDLEDILTRYYENFINIYNTTNSDGSRLFRLEDAFKLSNFCQGKSDKIQEAIDLYKNNIENGIPQISIEKCKLILINVPKDDTEWFNNVIALAKIKSKDKGIFHQFDFVEIIKNKELCARTLELINTIGIERYGSPYSWEKIMSDAKAFERAKILLSLKNGNEYIYNYNSVRSNNILDGEIFDRLMSLFEIRDKNGNCLLDRYTAENIAKDENAYKCALKLLELKDENGKNIYDASVLTCLTNNYAGGNHCLERITELLDKNIIIKSNNAKLNNYLLQHIVTSDDAWERFQLYADKDLDAILKAAFVFCEFTPEEADTLLSAIKSGDKPIISESDLALILLKFSQMYLGKDATINCSKFMIDYISKNPQEKEFIAQNADTVLLAGIDVAKKMVQYPFLLNEQGVIDITAGAAIPVNIRFYIFGHFDTLRNPTPEKIKEMNDYFSTNFGFSALDALKAANLKPEIAKKLLNNSENSDTLPLKVKLVQELYEKGTFPEDFIERILTYNYETMLEMVEYYTQKPEEMEKFINYLTTEQDFRLKYFDAKTPEKTLKEAEKMVEEQLEKCLIHPDLYVNGEVEEEISEKAIGKVFKKIIAAYEKDPEALEKIMEKALTAAVKAGNEEDQKALEEIIAVVKTLKEEAAKEGKTFDKESLPKAIYEALKTRELEKMVREFFKKHPYIKIAGSILGAEALDDIMRYRFEDAEEYMADLLSLPYKDKMLLKRMVNSLNQDGKPFNSVEKANMLYLLNVYIKLDIPLTQIIDMVDNNRLNFRELNINLFKTILETSGIAPEKIAEIPEEKILEWNMKYMHLLALEMQNDQTGILNDMILATTNSNFIEYILSPSNKYGEINAQTRRMFEEKGLNYDAWLNPNPGCEVTFRSLDTNQERLRQIAKQIAEDIETLRATPAKAVIDKSFKKFIKNDKFFIPANIEMNKEKLTNLVKDLLTQLNKLWKRAEGNVHSSDATRAQNASNALMIKGHLEQRMLDIEQSQKSTDGLKKSLNWTVKMWDRVPQKDVFQGNYSTCCIGMNGGNGIAMPNYLMNTMFSMIEIKDTVTGNVVGNALCYFAVNNEGEPVFVVDNIEIKNSVKPSDNAGKSLRTAIAQYARNITAQITGKPDTPIYLGKSYNDVPNDNLESGKATLTMLGQMTCDEIYADMFGGWESIKPKEVEYFDLGDGIEPQEPKPQPPTPPVPPTSPPPPPTPPTKPSTAPTPAAANKAAAEKQVAENSPQKPKNQYDKDFVLNTIIRPSEKENLTEEDIALLVQGLNDELIAPHYLNYYRISYLINLVKTHQYKESNGILGHVTLDLSKVSRNITAKDAAELVTQLDVSDIGYLDGSLLQKFEKIFEGNVFVRLHKFNELPLEVKHYIATRVFPNNFHILQKILDTIPATEILTEEDFSRCLKSPAVLYDCYPHTIAFGDEKVTVDTEYLVSLLTGRIYSGGQDRFNELTEALVEKSHRGQGLQYKNIAEGILIQNPGLLDVCKRYNAFCDGLKNKNAEELNAFFENLDKDGIFPKQITLNTIVPDPNSLVSTYDTCDIVQARFDRQKLNPPYAPPEKIWTPKDIMEAKETLMDSEDAALLARGINEGIISENVLRMYNFDSLKNRIETYDYKVANGIYKNENLDISGISRDISPADAAKKALTLDLSNEDYTNGKLEKKFADLFAENTFARLEAFSKLPFIIQKTIASAVYSSSLSVLKILLDTIPAETIENSDDYCRHIKDIEKAQRLEQIRTFFDKNCMPRGTAPKVSGDFSTKKVNSAPVQDEDSIMVLMDAKNFDRVYLHDIENHREFHFIINENGEKELVLPYDIGEYLHSTSSAENALEKSTFIGYASGDGKIYDCDGNSLRFETLKQKARRLGSNLLLNRSQLHAIRSVQVNRDGARIISKILRTTQDFDEIVSQYKQVIFGDREISAETQEILEAKVRFALKNMRLLDAELSRVKPNAFPRTYWRGLRLSVGDAKVLLDAKEGDIVVPDAGYAFATRNKHLAEAYLATKDDIILEVHTPVGTQVSKLPNNQDQVLFKRNVKYKVIGRYKDEFDRTIVKLQMLLDYENAPIPDDMSSKKTAKNKSDSATDDIETAHQTKNEKDTALSENNDTILSAIEKKYSGLSIPDVAEDNAGQAELTQGSTSVRDELVLEAAIAAGALSDNISLEAKNDISALKKSEAKIRAEFEIWLSNQKTKDEKPRFNAKESKRLARIVNAENINHIKMLVEISTNDDAPRFDIYEIRQLAKIVNSKNIDCIVRLAKLSTADGKVRLKKYFANLAEFVNNKNIDCIVRLAEILDSKKELRFDEKDILFIARVLNDNNIDFTEELAGLTNAKGEARFSAYDIADILGVAHENNKDYIKNLLAMKTKDNRPRFDSQGIRYLIIATNERNKKYVHELINMVKQDGTPRFNGLEAGNIAFITNEKNKNYVKELIDMVNNDGEPRCDGAEIKDIVKITDEENKDLIKELLNMVNKDGEPRFNGFEIKLIMEITNEKNRDYVKELIDMVNKDGEPRCDGAEIKDIVKITNEENKDYIKELLELKKSDDTPRLRAYEIRGIIDAINENNIDFIRKLIRMETEYGTPIFTAYDIEQIGRVLNTKNYNFITLWVIGKQYGAKSRFSCSEMAVIAKVVNENNENLIKELIDMVNKDGEPRFNGYGIAEIAGMANANNWGFVKELMELETPDGLPQFNGCQIRAIAQVKGIDINYIKELIDMVNKDGEPRFNGAEIAAIAEVTNEENKDLIKELIDMVNNDGEPRFDGFSIKDIVEITNEKNRDLIKELLDTVTEGGKISTYELKELASVINKSNISLVKKLIELKTENGEDEYTLSEIVQIAEFANNAQNIRIMRELLDPNISFLNSDEISDIARICSKIDILKNMPFSNKISYLQDLKDALNYIEESEARKTIEEKVAIFEKSMNQAIEPISVSKKVIADFWQAFLTTANKENANVIKSLNSFVEKYNESGFPLEFSREDFVKELASVLESLPEEQKTAILEKLGIQLGNDTYEGFINLKSLDSKTASEAKIKKLCERFLLENKINTGNEQIDNFLNSLIKGMPELVNIIGKKAGVHDYTLDAHTLKVLCEVVSDPKFETLSNQAKMIAQLVALFHDVGKLSGVDDMGHEHSSSIVANDILKKVSMPEFIKRRVVELIKNHNWLKLFNEGKIDAKTAAVMFRNPEDIKIAEIFVQADLKSVDNNFYMQHFASIKPAIEEITKELEALHSGGNMIFPTRILNLEKIPEVEYNGQKYRVLDITKLPDDVDLSQFGLSVKDKKDLRFLFHSGEMGTMQILMKPFNDGHVCTTLISPSRKFTFGQIKGSNMDVGMIIDAPNANVINSAQTDQYSPIRGGFGAFVDMAFNNEINNYTKHVDRIFQREIFIKMLSEKYSIKESDYGEIYKKLIDKRFLGEMTDITLSCGITIKAEDIINAYKAIEDKIMQYTTSEINEINIYNPQVTGVVVIGNSLSDIPPQTLKYIQEHNLPIFILGSNSPKDIDQMEDVIGKTAAQDSPQTY